MNYRDLNKLFNDNSHRFAGSAHAARRLERREWALNGDKYAFSGITQAKGEKSLRLEAHFCCITSKRDACWVNRIKIDLEDALDCISGNLNGINRA